MILFETTTSIVEILWDIALFIFITRLGFYYFALSYLSSLATQATYIYLSSLHPLSYLAQPQAEPIIILTIQLLLSTLIAKWLIIWHEIPRVQGFRLAIGGVAGVFFILTELLSALVKWECGLRVWIWEMDLRGQNLRMSALVVFVLIPWLLTVFERRGRKEEEEEVEIAYGNEKKDVAGTVQRDGVAA
ncbi:hypothetical protein VTL71DRAFT_13680 [Oculimacula yallundae]|uniref:Integral membrane protein n=1 Tax=Oculimacula yallundae TaxID=86028 RepID=A0ABR4CNK9_9HELO